MLLKKSRLVVGLLLTLVLLSTVCLPAFATGEEPVELVVTYVCSEPADQQMIVDAVNEILIEKHNIKIKTVVPNFSNYSTQLTLMLSSNEQLDVLAELAARFSSDVANGSLLDMTDLLAEHGEGIVDAIGTQYLAAGQINGNQYAVTTFRDLAQGYSFFMRADLCDKYGIDPEAITTLEQMGDAFQIIHENEPGITPLVADVTLYPSFRMNNVDQLGNLMGVLMNMGTENLDVVNYYETERFEETVHLFREWYLAGYISEEHVTSRVTYQEVMKAGQGFAYFIASKPNVVPDEVAKVGGVELYEAKIVPAFTYTSAPQTLQWAIAGKTEYPEEAMLFLNELYTNPDIMNLFAWGIEGVHYVKTDDGHITYPEGIDATNSGYDLRRGWAFGNQALTYIWEGVSLSAWDDLAEFNANAIVSKAMGFTWDATGMETEVAAVQNVFDEYRVALEFGLLDPDEYIPAFQQRLKEAGIDRIVASKQEQLDAWAVVNGVE